jgi:hypothetical protein
MALQQMLGVAAPAHFAAFRLRLRPCPRWPWRLRPRRRLDAARDACVGSRSSGAVQP